MKGLLRPAGIVALCLALASAAWGQYGNYGGGYNPYTGGYAPQPSYNPYTGNYGIRYPYARPGSYYNPYINPPSHIEALRNPFTGNYNVYRPY